MRHKKIQIEIDKKYCVIGMIGKTRYDKQCPFVTEIPPEKRLSQHTNGCNLHMTTLDQDLNGFRRSDLCKVQL